MVNIEQTQHFLGDASHGESVKVESIPRTGTEFATQRESTRSGVVGDYYEVDNRLRDPGLSIHTYVITRVRTGETDGKRYVTYQWYEGFIENGVDVIYKHNDLIEKSI